MATVEDDFNTAKAFLMQSSPNSDVSLYNHLASVLTKLLDEKPGDAVGILESISQELKADKITTSTTIQEKPAVPTEFPTAEKRVKLFGVEVNGDDDALTDNDYVPLVPDILTRCQLFEDGGVGLGREESFRVFLAIKELAESKGDQFTRPFEFWGKIFGTEHDYYVCECEYSEDPPVEDEPAEEEEQKEDGGDEDEVPLPKSAFLAPKPLPNEPAKEGVNKKAYFVCNEPGGEWTLLPVATPGAIVAARQMRLFFSGDLTKKMGGYSTDLSADKNRSSYPPFEGTEKEFLRAQIARISADTHLCPDQLYALDEDEEDEESLPQFNKEEEYEGWESKDSLLAPSMSGWVHYEYDILPQGRCLWKNPAPPKPEPEDDEEEEEEEEEVEPETGRILLNPALDDAQIDDQPAWCTRLTSDKNPAFSAVMASSNLWPGSHCVSYDSGKSYSNIYVGWGQIYSSSTFNPTLPPMSSTEYEIDETVTEQTDPTIEEEEQFKADQEAKAAEGEDEEDD